MKEDESKLMKRLLLKLYAFNFFQSQKKEHTVLIMFWVLVFCLFFYFYFRARFPAFLFARVNLPIESKVWSRVARTNYMRTKQGYYVSSWTVPVVDPGEGTGPPPHPHPPLSEGLDSPLHSVTLTKWISYSYI